MIRQFTIRAVTLGSTITTLAGNGCLIYARQDAGHAVLPLYSGGVAADASGNLHCDTSADVIRKVTPDGLLQTIYGKPGVTAIGGENTISSPQGVTRRPTVTC